MAGGSGDGGRRGRGRRVRWGRWQPWRGGQVSGRDRGRCRGCDEATAQLPDERHDHRHDRFHPRGGPGRRTRTDRFLGAARRYDGPGARAGGRDLSEGESYVLLQPAQSDTGAGGEVRGPVAQAVDRRVFLVLGRRCAHHEPERGAPLLGAAQGRVERRRHRPGRWAVRGDRDERWLAAGKRARQGVHSRHRSGLGSALGDHRPPEARRPGRLRPASDRSRFRRHAQRLQPADRARGAPGAPWI